MSNLIGIAFYLMFAGLGIYLIGFFTCLICWIREGSNTGFNEYGFDHWTRWTVPVSILVGLGGVWIVVYTILSTGTPLP